MRCINEAIKLAFIDESDFLSCEYYTRYANCFF